MPARFVEGLADDAHPALTDLAKDREPAGRQRRAGLEGRQVSRETGVVVCAPHRDEDAGLQ